ncbi:MAG: helix-turn-helix domain-containing protein [Planctomycetota bacterium]|nr:helix-turn-helix domain-containing protein [Planctomycetota bacterium]
MFPDGQAIRQARRAKGLTQKGLAEMVGTYPFAISRIERNDLRPCRALLDAISEALAVDLTDWPVSEYAEQVRRKIPELADPEWLRQKLIVEGLTYQRIGDLVGCSRQRVHQRAQQFGLHRPRRPAASRKPKKRRVIPLKGLLKEKRLRALYNGKLYIARVYRSGRLRMRATGEVYDSPDAAATAVCEQETDGWEFWHYKNPQLGWVPLNTLRQPPDRDESLQEGADIDTRFL